MPNSFISVGVVLVSLAPGFCFLAFLERRQAGRPYSPLRELGVVVTASVAFDAVAIILFGLIRVALPDLTPNAGGLVREGGDYLTLHYVTVGAWGGLMLLATCGLAALAGTVVGKSGSGSQPIKWASGWKRAFEEYPECYVSVGCELVDGTYVTGWLKSFSPDAEETNDRSLTLAAPATIRRVGSDPEDWRIGEIVLPASQLRFVAVGYHDHGPGAEATGTVTPPRDTR